MAFLLLVIPLFFTVGAQNLPVCQNKTFTTEGNWSSLNLLPIGNFSLDLPCEYRFNFPDDTAFCGNFSLLPGINSAAYPYVNSTLIDAFGTEYNLAHFVQPSGCLPPPFFRILVFKSSFKDPTLNKEGSINISIKENTCGGCETFRLIKFNLTSNVEEYTISSGEKPRIIIFNRSLEEQSTYKIKGSPKFSAYFLNYATPGNIGGRSHLKVTDGSSIFLLNGTDEYSQIIGTAGQWTKALPVRDHWSFVQEFSELNFFQISPGITDKWVDQPPLMILMDSGEFNGLSNSRFIRPGDVFEADGRQNPISITIVDTDAYNNDSCRRYTSDCIFYTEDVEFIVYNGFPRKNITENTVIGRFTAAQLNRQFTLILSCTTTFKVLSGFLRFQSFLESGISLTVTQWGYDYFLPFQYATLLANIDQKTISDPTKPIYFAIREHAYTNNRTIQWAVIKTGQNSTISIDMGREEEINPETKTTGNITALNKGNSALTLTGPMTAIFNITCEGWKPIINPKFSRPADWKTERYGYQRNSTDE